jgi:hypothetical protein
MSRPIPRALALSALIPTLFMSGVGLAVPATTGRADDCLAAPNSAAPQGSHWFYKLDRATKRKCWYVRAPSQTAQQATAPAKKSPGTSFATPVPSGAVPAPAPASPGEASPHVGMSAVKPHWPVSRGASEDTAPSNPAVSAAPASTGPTPTALAPQNVTPAISAITDRSFPQDPEGEYTASTPDAPAAPATTPVEVSEPTPNDAPAIDKSVPQSAHQSNAASIPTANPPPGSTPSAASDQANAPPTVKWAPLVKAVDRAVPSNASTTSVSNDANRKTSAGEPTNSSGMLIMGAIMGLALVGVIWRLTRKDIEWAEGVSPSAPHRSGGLRTTGGRESFL